MNHGISPNEAITHNTSHCGTSVCLFQKVQSGVTTANLKITEPHSPPRWRSSVLGPYILGRSIKGWQLFVRAWYVVAYLFKPVMGTRGHHGISLARERRSLWEQETCKENGEWVVSEQTDCSGSVCRCQLGFALGITWTLFLSTELSRKCPSHSSDNHVLLAPPLGRFSERSLFLLHFSCSFHRGLLLTGPCFSCSICLWHRQSCRI